MADYDHSHIVQRAYLAQWEVDGLLTVHFVSSGESKRISSTNAAVRSRFYVERAEDGSRSAPLEHELGRVEDAAIGLVRDITRRWPLNQDERFILTEYVAVQILRSPAWRYWHEEVLENTLPKYRQQISAPARQQYDTIARSDKNRHDTLRQMINQVGAMVGSMHWHLLRFSSPKVVTSDHPVVVTPLGPGNLVHSAPIPAAGFAETLEMVFPLGPHHALVMSWADPPEDGRIRTGTPDQLRSLNATVVGQAEKQWFHRPKLSPPRRVRHARPLSFELARGYSVEAARGSERRRRTLAIVEDLIENREKRMTMLAVTPANSPAG